VYFGGGTPSLMSAASVFKIIEKIGRLWSFDSDAEITLEANPKTISCAGMAALSKAGINRLSIGAQSLSDDALKLLGRAHGAAAALRVVEDAKAVFANVNCDFIYGLPGQSADGWAEELSRIASLGVPHLSLYQLTLARGTPMWRYARAGIVKPAGEEILLRMFRYTNRRLRGTIPQYEISNYAKPGFESRHNINYWTGGDYVGIGPAAAGRISVPGGFLATKNPADAGEWKKSVFARKNRVFDKISPKERGIEAVISGLRMNRGIGFAEFEENTGARFWDVACKAAAEELARDKFVRLGASGIRALEKGRAVLDRVIEKIVK
jgi:oxygen-independent coproporphyrinogen-3 oxidase